MTDGWDDDFTGTPSAAEAAKATALKADEKLAATHIDIALENTPKQPGVDITKAVDKGPKALVEAVNEKDAKTAIVPYAQESRKHWVTVKVTKENNKINVELIDSKGGATKRPEAEYSKNPLKRFGQKLADKVGGLVDKIKSAVVGERELAEIKKELKAQNPGMEVTTKLTRLETQRDDIHCGRHTVEIAAAIATGKPIETDINKANTNLQAVTERINNPAPSTPQPEQQSQTRPRSRTLSPALQEFQTRARANTTIVQSNGSLPSPDQTPSVSAGVSKSASRG